MAGALEEKALGQCRDAADKLARDCSRLTELLYRLEQELEPVTRARADCPAPQSEEPDLVPLARQVWESCRSIQDAIGFTAELIDRLEI
jgi:hypothetical protein